MFGWWTIFEAARACHPEHADPDIPILMEAKAEYAKLQ
jgi:hypothetical protein